MLNLQPFIFSYFLSDISSLDIFEADFMC